MYKDIKLPEIPEAERTPLIDQLIELIQELAETTQRQAEEIAQLKDEIAVLKKQKKRPLKSCQMLVKRDRCRNLKILQQGFYCS